MVHVYSVAVFTSDDVPFVDFRKVEELSEVRKVELALLLRCCACVLFHTYAVGRRVEVVLITPSLDSHCFCNPLLSSYTKCSNKLYTFCTISSYLYSFGMRKITNLLTSQNMEEEDKYTLYVQDKST